jgi:hypothetical protein
MPSYLTRDDTRWGGKCSLPIPRIVAHTHAIGGSEMVLFCAPNSTFSTLDHFSDWSRDGSLTNQKSRFLLMLTSSVEIGNGKFQNYFLPVFLILSDYVW